MGAALYGIRAVVAHSADVNSASQEREWQLELLLEYAKQAR
ncbi:hypothetical protein [Dehalococcoides mccartyi]|nr:hypothetical protein [Dehalococcoides mccartyi]